MKRRPSFKNLPKIQAKRFKKLRLEKERARAGRTRNRPINKTGRERLDRQENRGVLIGRFLPSRHKGAKR